MIEITESEFISNYFEFEKVLRKVRDLGILLAIDDFGAGYAGLSLLTNFQPEKVKLDRELIENIHVDGPKQAIVKSIVTCCNELAINIIAEGIEKIEEWCYLESIGIHLFQGFLFARPKLNQESHIFWPQRIV